ncbi:NAD(P)-dependent oxidoreductase [Sphingomonas sp. LB-2]|uniref:NAD(P)-dependent oxidoreductase n=1 Tax=Sphingomonas caeni TaxID=2984949 RepID=UPI0022325B4C|nr:NAD(P)-dependent oxidoreductase [Sphingomonas caeni]MCW3849275.1 NAD(P)-dependent oxidoreductase [Sphingomonas caeni]
MKIAFLGLGMMGSGIAGNLLRAGHELRLWNRSPEKADALVAAGATLAATPREAGEGADIAFTMVADDHALLGLLEGPDGLIAGLPTGAIHVSQSTISVAAADRIAALHADRGQTLVSAPVFGRPAVAEAGQLWIVTGGPAAALETCAPLFDAIGRAVFPVGDTASAANLVKLCGNFMILATTEAMGEAMLLSERGGVPRTKLLEVLQGTLFDAPIYKIYGPLVAEQRWRPAGFAAPLGLKDMRLACEAADAVGTTLPILHIIRDHLEIAIEREGSDVDVAALVSALP